MAYEDYFFVNAFPFFFPPPLPHPFELGRTPFPFFTGMTRHLLFSLIISPFFLIPQLTLRFLPPIFWKDEASFFPPQGTPFFPLDPLASAVFPPGRPNHPSLPKDLSLFPAPPRFLFFFPSNSIGTEILPQPVSKVFAANNQ